MRLIKCENCGRQMPLINGINYNIVRYWSESTNDFCVCFRALLSVYCANCNDIYFFNIVHYFDKDFCKDLSDEDLLKETFNIEGLFVELPNNLY